MTRILIVGSESPTQDQIGHLTGQIVHLWYFHRLHSWGGLEILLGDGYGADVYLAQSCIAHSLIHVVYGVTVAPFNNISRKHYKQLDIDGRGIIERRRLRDQYMLEACDKVITIGNTERCRAMNAYAETHGKVPVRYDARYFPPEWESKLCRLR